LRAIIEGRLHWSDEIEGPLYDCLLCGACTANCFPAIPTAELVTRARSQYLEKVGRKPAHRLLFDYLLPYPRRLHLAARAVALGKNTGLSDLAKALGLLRIFGRDFVKADEMIERLPPQPFRDRVKPGLMAGSGSAGKIGYFVGCGIDIICQDAGNATLELLRASAQSVSLLNNCCCGLPGWSYGDLAAARKLAARNIDLLIEESYDAIVTDCSSCASFLKSYPNLFREDDPQHAKAVDIAHRVQDAVQWIKNHPAEPEIRFEGKTFTYHDPCHASRGQGITAEPREILQALHRAAYVEMPEADWCCGGAGAYALSHYDISSRVLDRKMDNLEKTAADYLVTSCPACVIQLSYGVRRRGIDTKVIHISEVLHSSPISFS
jgi:glycolate oxidase iron-sulfur subunit